jgi:uncharacterized protein YndB with AHSA1/START domain
MTDMQTMVKEIDISASPERIFKADTDADELGSWMAMSAESDPTPGGVFVLNWTQFGMTGNFGETEPPVRE